MALAWTCKHFTDLTPDELYAILRLRSEVFVVEQQCVFLDADGKDAGSYHLMGWAEDHLAAYARIVPPAVSFEEVSIGRVVTSPQSRKSGHGKALMQRAIAECYQLFGRSPIRIGAQCYLKAFYQSFGFRPAGPVYDEDGIDHMEMTLTP